jgi:hypothetical protein
VTSIGTMCLCALAAFGLASCRPANQVETASGGVFVRTPASTDIDALAKYIALPKRPLAVIWETLSLSEPGTPGPTDWYLMGILQYPEEDLRAFINRSERATDPVVLDFNELRPWFPENLKAAWKTGTAGRFQLPGPSYKAAIFYKGSLHEGYFAAVPNTDELFLFIQCCTAVIPGK